MVTIFLLPLLVDSKSGSKFSKSTEIGSKSSAMMRIVRGSDGFSPSSALILAFSASKSASDQGAADNFVVETEDRTDSPWATDVSDAMIRINRRDTIVVSFGAAVVLTIEIRPFHCQQHENSLRLSTLARSPSSSFQ